MTTKKSDQKEELLITVADAAELKGVSKVRIHQWIADGRLRKEICFGRTVVYRDEVLALEPRLGGRPRKESDLGI